MATFETLTVKFEADKRGFERGAQSVERSLAGITRTAKAMGAAIVAAVGVQGVRAMGQFVREGGKAANVALAFERATRGQVGALQQLQKATGGVVRSQDLMVQFNRALALGAVTNTQEFTQLAQTARTLGRALGVDTAFAVESLSMGIGRQSKLILDNLGIIVNAEEANERYARSIGKTVKELTEAEKKEAFRSEVMRRSKDLVEEMGGVTENAADSWQRMVVQMMNAVDALKMAVAESTTLKNILDRFPELVDRVRGISPREREVQNRAMGLPDSMVQSGIHAANARRSRLEHDLAKIDEAISSRGALTNLTGWLETNAGFLDWANLGQKFLDRPESTLEDARRELQNEIDAAAAAIDILSGRLANLNRVTSASGSGVVIPGAPLGFEGGLPPEYPWDRVYGSPVPGIEGMRRRTPLERYRNPFMFGAPPVPGAPGFSPGWNGFTGPPVPMLPPGGGGGMFSDLGAGLKNMFDPKNIVTGMGMGIGSTILSGAMSALGELGKDILGLQSAQDRLREAVENNTRVLQLVSPQRLGSELEAAGLTGTATELIPVLRMALEDAALGRNGLGEGGLFDRSFAAATVFGENFGDIQALAKTLGIDLGGFQLDTFQQLLQALETATGGLDGLSDAANRVTAALLNVPSGFKVALARYQVAEPVMQSPPVSGGGGGGTTIVVETMTVQANNPREFVNQLAVEQQRLSRRGTTLLGATLDQQRARAF